MESETNFVPTLLQKGVLCSENTRLYSDIPHMYSVWVLLGIFRWRINPNVPECTPNVPECTVVLLWYLCGTSVVLLWYRCSTFCYGKISFAGSVYNNHFSESCIMMSSTCQSNAIVSLQ